MVSYTASVHKITFVFAVSASFVAGLLSTIASNPIDVVKVQGV